MGARVSREQFAAMLLKKPELAEAVKKPSKYGNKKIVIDGITFDSKKEGRRYEYLKHLQTSGAIQDLRCHHQIALIVKGIEICRYEMDFDYAIVDSGDHVIEDVKGHKTAVYQLKKKLLKAIYGIDISEIK
jgi:hypothetical protein